MSCVHNVIMNLLNSIKKFTSFTSVEEKKQARLQNDVNARRKKNVEKLKKDESSPWTFPLALIHSTLNLNVKWQITKKTEVQ